MIRQQRNQQQRSVSLKDWQEHTEILVELMPLEHILQALVEILGRGRKLQQTRNSRSRETELAKQLLAIVE